MGLAKKLAAAFLSCALSCASVICSAAPSDAAAKGVMDKNSLFVYDSTKTAESKEADPSENPFKVFDIYNAYFNKTTTTTTTTTTLPTTIATTVTTTTSTAPTTAFLPETTTVPTTEPPSDYLFSKGIDVSKYQGTIDWQAVKDSGISFVIVQAGYGKYSFQADPRLDENIRGAQAVGIDVGVYWYSYAFTPEDARLEAEVCYDIIKDYNLTFPVYYDIEEPQHSQISVATSSAIVDSFCSTMESKGYFTGVYSYAWFLEANIYREVLEKYDVWVAQYNYAPYSYSGKYGIWQYSGSGYVNGINGQVDLDYSYRNYPYLISPETYTGTFPAATTQTTLQTSTTQTTLQTSTTPVSTAATVSAPTDRVGVNVSADKGDINWQNVKDSGCTFALINAGQGTEADAKFEENFKNAKNAGLYTGAYWTCTSTSEADALAEAEAFYQTIKDKQFEYPLYLDLTSPSLTEAGLTAEDYSSLIKTFCSYFEGKSYYIGIYGNESFLNTALDPALFEAYDVWIASKNVASPSFSYKYGIWQFTVADIPGISSDTELNCCYRDYPSVMTYYHLNGF